MTKNLLRTLSLLLALIPWLASAVEEGDLLDPDKAFAFSARAIDARTLEVRYQIADGYYMYRDKFKFELEPAGAKFGSYKLPPGKMKDDPTFGRVETYRGTLVLKLPISVPAGTSSITLKATSQGCADVGVCYMPQTHTVKIDLPGGAAASGKGALATLRDLGVELGGGADELLPPEEAFRLAAKVKGADGVAVTITPSANVYIYKDKLAFKVVQGAGVSVKDVKLPPGELKDDPTFGKTEVYHVPVTAELTLARAAGSAQEIVLQVDYQGCNGKIGVCYPPQTKRLNLTLAGAAGPAPATATAPAPSADVAPAADSVAPKGGPAVAPTEAAGEDEQSKVAQLLKGGNFWAIIVAFFGFGLLLSLTPCVFPMIPILSGIIVGQGKQLTKTQGFVLSLAYVLGMAITYAIAGVIAGKSGAMISAALQNAWVLGAFALIFVALALSMFGFYDLQLPSFIQSRFTEASNKMKGGNLIGVFVMGALSAVIVGPCVAAPLAGALLYISQTQDMWLGGWALFSMAMGMGVPLLLVGVAGGALLPRAGAWMNGVKAFFGVLLLGVAIWLISPVIPAVVHMLLWAALLIVSSIYLHALDPLPPNASGFRKLWKGVGVIALVVGVIIMLGALGGGRDILQPLSGLQLGTAGGGTAVAAQPQGLQFEKVKNVAELDARIAAAKGKYVMLDFYADWCVSCKEMIRFTFSDPRVQERLKDVVLLKADVTANTEDDKALLKRFKLFGPPGIIFFDREGNEQTLRVIGFQPADKFLQSLDSVLK